MKISDYINNPIESYIKAERYINNGSPSGFTINTTSVDTSPRQGKKTYDLGLYVFQEEIIIKNVGETINVIPSNVIPIHPDMVSHKVFSNVGLSQVGCLNVSPTASGRTVFDSKKKSFIKLAYLDYLGRIVRHMEANKLLSAVEVTNQLIKVAKGGKTNPAFSFLREDQGRIAYIPFKLFNKEFMDKIPLSCYNSQKYEYGVLFREFSPYPYINSKEHLMPFFSLFSNEYDPISNTLNTDHIPFVIQFFNSQTKPIERFVLEDIMYPLFNTYFDALLLGGIELEAHAQNMLIAFDDNYRIKRIVCRDLESAGRDIDLMCYLGIEYKTTIKDYKCNTRKPRESGEKYDKYTITHSFMFDFKLGEYIVSPLLRLISQYIPTFDIEKVEDKIKEFNKQFINKLPKDFFPCGEWCSYKSVNYEKTGQKRVYEWHQNPKYR